MNSFLIINMAIDVQVGNSEILHNAYDTNNVSDKRSLYLIAIDNALENVRRLKRREKPKKTTDHFYLKEAVNGYFKTFGSTNDVPEEFKPAYDLWKENGFGNEVCNILYNSCDIKKNKLNFECIDKNNLVTLIK